PSGVDAVLVLDASRSMTRTDPQRLRDQGAKLFLRFLNPRDRIGLIEFDRHAKVLFELTDVSVKNLRSIDEGVDTVSTEGGFTNLHAALLASLKLLRRSAREESAKGVVLLSDGKMDPHPEEGTREEITKRLIEEELPKFKEAGIKVYTLALSDAADKELLYRIATATGGQYWFAPDAETIHKKFSELFLALKKPQVVELTAGGFEIDQSVREATFYVSREGITDELVLIDPKGERITENQLPIGVKWFGGKRFDVVTVQEPIAGKWAIEGVKDPEGYATLLTDLEVQVKWPQTEVNIGDRLLVLARLTEKGEVLELPELEQELTYGYQIVDSERGLPVASGTLNDNGEDGDEKAGDDIFSSVIRFEEEGELRAIVGVKGPTFVRQQQIPFTVSGAKIVLAIEPADEFTGKPERFRATIDESVSHLKKLTVTLVAQPEGEQPEAEAAGKSVEMVHLREPENTYEVETSVLPGGSFSIYAEVSGVDGRDTKTYSSKSLEFVSEEEPPEPEEPNYVLWYIIFLLLTVVWCGALAFVNLRKAFAKRASVSVRKPYEVPDELTQAVSDLKDRASEAKREPSEADKALKEISLEAPPALAKALGGEGREEQAEAAVEAGDDAGDSQAEDAAGDDTQAEEASAEEAGAEEVESGDEAEEGGDEAPEAAGADDDEAAAEPDEDASEEEESDADEAEDDERES
ncbi:MAG: VWA domain-containing protein, partial [Bdellovibrionales bacterium]|nr:VWA domain-containing protein [Bdellovibrionales bacterium]